MGPGYLSGPIWPQKERTYIEKYSCMKTTLTNIERKEVLIMRTFKLGQIVATDDVVKAVLSNTDFAEFVKTSLDRYMACDWGSMCSSDKKLNDAAVLNGNQRILAVYKTSRSKDWTIYIITECDRSLTTILFPYEY